MENKWDLEILKKILEILESKRVPTKKWLRWKLILQGVDPQYARELAKHEKADRFLLKMNTEKINKIMSSLPKILENELKRYKIEPTAKIRKNPVVALYNLMKAKERGLPIDKNTILRKQNFKENN